MVFLLSNRKPTKSGGILKDTTRPLWVRGNDALVQTLCLTPESLSDDGVLSWISLDLGGGGGG